MRRPAIVSGEPHFPEGLRFARPLTPPMERVTQLLAPSWESGGITNGRLVKQFEEQVQERMGVTHAVAVSCCTSGLMLSLRALQVEGAVVLPSFTFAASAHAVAWNGLEVRFAECDAEGFHLDTDDAATRMEGAGAVMATHVFGAPCDVDRIGALAARHGVPVVYDAAHGFGALRQGRAVGTFGDVEVFSLSPTKLVVSGEGGVVTTHRAEIAEAVRVGRDYGNPGDYDMRFVGLNARMSELHAAVALASLEQLDEHLTVRQQLADAYRNALADIPGVAVQRVADGDRSTYKDFTITVDAEQFGLPRDVVRRGLTAEGIDTRCYFAPPVHRTQAYAGGPLVDLPVTDAVSERVLSLPMFAALPPDAVAKVADAMAALSHHAEEVGAAVLA